MVVRFVDGADQDHDAELDPADQDLAALLLAADGVAHALGQVLRPAAVEQPGAEAGEHQRFSSQRLVASASAGRGRRATTERASRSAEPALRPDAGEQRLIGAGRQQRQHALLLVVVPPAPHRRVVERQEDVVDVDQRAGRQRGRTRLSRMSTSLPGIRMWLESMNSTSPARRPSNRLSGAACRVEGTTRTPGRPAMSARGAGSIARISPTPPCGAGQHAGRMARADLDDALRLALAHQRIGDSGVERGEPRLLEAGSSGPRARLACASTVSRTPANAAAWPSNSASIAG